MRRLPTLMLALAALGRGGAASETPGLAARLTASAAGYALRSTSLVDALTKISARFHIPMGVEWVRDAETLRALDLSWDSGDAASVISSVARHYPGYAWRADGGVVNVFRRGLPGSRHNFLNLTVPRWFRARGEVGGRVSQDLQLVAQNMVVPRELPPGAGVGGSYASGNVVEKPLTLALAGPTFRQALNELVERSEHKLWIVTFSPGAGLTPTSFWRTETLWHPSAFPDASQPMWDFLAWPQHLARR